VAGGGDGTLSCAAGHLAGGARPLGILPLGTLNHLARDAGIPAKLEEAVAVIAAGHIRAIDVAEVNGRVFVNNSSVGLYPDMVRLREVEQERLGRSKRLAMLSASLTTLRHFRRHRLRISAEGLEAPVRTPMLFVGNNRYQVNLLALGQREALDEGELCLYAIRASSRAHLLWAGIRGIFGKLDQQRDFITSYVGEAEVSSDRDSLIVSADGETVQLETPLRYRIRPKALKLIVPAP
jgi:diacylglycerol kinase family enzyme